MRQKRIFKIVCALVLTVCLAISLFSASAFVYAAEGEPTVTIDDNGSRLVAKTENIINPTYQWKIADAEDGAYSNISGATGRYYDITAADEGKYIKVEVNNSIKSEATEPIGKLVVFDLAKGAISLGETYSGMDANNTTVSGTHMATNIYVVTQSNNSTLTTNNITFLGNLPDKPFDVTLAGVHMGNTTYDTKEPNSSGQASYETGTIDIKAPSSSQKKVTLRLKGENIVRVIHYYTENGIKTTESSLKITDINGDGATDGGSLYMPVKVEPEDIDSFVQTKTNYNHWNSAIGGDDSQQDVVNLHIAGGKLQILTTYGDNCTAIGGGGNGYCRMTISGGDIVAHCNGTGTAIGGGIGWNSAGGQSDITITGGNIYAKNHGEIYVKATRDADGKVTSTKITTKDGDYNEVVGGVAIGSGSSFISSGSEGKVTITGGTIEAYGTYGNGIGGGNSSSSVGGKATINISGGVVDATSIGGGNSQKGVGGSATVTINGDADVTLSGGIGGGDSVSGTGGEATVTVKSGSLNCGGVIGGGNGGGTGNGGKATINVDGGTLTAASVGGGIGSVGGDGGAAVINITDGKIETGSIGGGSTLNTTDGKLGYAKAIIIGGDISGQFLMAAGGTEACTFTMTGGTLHGVNTADTSKYTYVQENGAAVYMDDPNGVVTMTGGTIQDCSAVDGGAVYMTAGTFTIGTGKVDGIETVGVIKNCTATNNGGAVYLGGGTMNVDGGQIIDNNAGNSGGGAYINGGNVVVTGGSVSDNIAVNDGGAIAVNNGNYTMTGGNVDNNTSTKGSGGGIYVASAGTDNVAVNVFSGSVSNNSAKQNGGALAVVGETESTANITVTVGVNKQHFDEDGNEISCEHGATNEGAYTCPVLVGNHVDASGGAVYVTGNYENTFLNLYCLEESGSTAAGDEGQSNFMKVDGGKVTVTTSEYADEANQTAKHGNTSIKNTIYVTGGQMDLWGEMTNPRLEEIITVDITKEDDYFKDHRQATGYYKLIYYENFTDSVIKVTTGQYKEKEIEADTWETISGNIYGHPGYTIVGWNTHPEKEHDYDQGEGPEGTPEYQGWYDVGADYLFNGNPIGDLTLYAIWEANGYVVKYNPNVPVGDTYSGTMEDEEFTYDMETELAFNAYRRPGYQFAGWAKTPTGEAEYQDGEKVINLTTERGKFVTLYAVWVECNHDPEEHEYTYFLTDNGATLKRDCSCGGYRETAALSANDTVYDRTAHPARVTYSSDTWKPQPCYYQGETELAGAPVNAGTYMVKVTDGGLTASVTYVIDKADQPAPDKPDFDAVTETNDDKTTSTLSVKPVALSPLGDDKSAEYDATYDSVAEYRIVYYVNGVAYTKDWVSDTDTTDAYAAVFELDVALTNYYIYARYSEGTNYKASEETPADSVYFFNGNVRFEVEKGAGILYTPVVADEDDVTLHGIILQVAAEANYYLPTGYDETVSGTVTLNDASETPTSATIETKVPYAEYQIKQIPANSMVHIVLPDARKIPTVSADITEKQVFGKVTTDFATISNDSAYTVYFDVNDYHLEDYENLSISVDTALPVGTTIIMQDKSNNGYYWFEVTTENIKTVGLTDFTRMGTEDTTYDPVEGNMDLQFMVDFSGVDAAKRLSSDITLTTTVTATVIQGSRAPELSSEDETKALANVKSAATFKLTPTNGSIGTVVYEHLASLGVASKWDDRHMALVLSPHVSGSDTTIPEDATITVSDGNATAVSYANCNGDFIIPLADLDSGKFDVYLGSSLFTEQEATYDFDVNWIVAGSLAESSPMNGEAVATTELKLTGSNVAGPSMRIAGDARLYSVGDTLKAELSWADMPTNHDMEVTLMIKTDMNQYSSTGWKKSISHDNAQGSIQFDVPLGGQKAGSYCLEVTADLGLVTVTKARFYFLIGQ